MDLSENDLRFLCCHYMTETLKALEGEQCRIRKYVSLLLDTVERKTGAAIPDNLREDILFASGIHDIGKLLIPVTILNKPDKLTNVRAGR